MASMLRRVGSMTLASALAIAACETTAPSEAPTGRPSASPSAEPSTAPSPSLRPTPRPTTGEPVRASFRLIGGPLNARVGPSGVWTGSDVIVWGGYHSSGGIARPETGYPRSGAALDPYSGQWHRIANAPIQGRYRHLAAWTGREMLVWGGYTEDWRSTQLPEGAAYNPKTDRWRPMAASPLPWAGGPAAVMGDDEWFMAATRNRGLVLVAAYDPRADSWRSLPSIPHLQSRENRLVRTDSALILMNSAEGMFVLEDGAEAWVHSASKPIGAEVVWTGEELIGLPGSWVDHHLVRYDAAADAWLEIPSPHLDGGRLIWIGTSVLVLGGFAAPSYLFNYMSGTWRELHWPEGHDVRDDVSIWTGHSLVEWGAWTGGDGAQPTDGGWVVWLDE
jgi:hypothetical protein